MQAGPGHHVPLGKRSRLPSNSTVASPFPFLSGAWCSPNLNREDAFDGNNDMIDVELERRKVMKDDRSLKHQVIELLAHSKLRVETCL